MLNNRGKETGQDQRVSSSFCILCSSALTLFSLHPHFPLACYHISIFTYRRNCLRVASMAPVPVIAQFLV